MDLDKLEKLNRLYREGALTEEEFNREKQRLEDVPPTPPTPPMPSADELPLGLSASSYMALMNFSLLFTSAGWIISIVLWILGKNKSALIDTQGKYIVNWIITWIIIGCVLALFFFGGMVAATRMPVFSALAFIPLIVFGLCVFIFPIVGGIKCLNGGTWRYPLSISFFK